jgi:DeoR family suf operon transcriptional repressor
MTLPSRDHDTTSTAASAPLKGLRGEILLALKRSQPRTARELGELLGVSANAIRHHLKELEAESLVAYGREQRGVGAPTFAYQLAPGGEALFPKRYEQTLVDVLDRLAGRDGRQAAVALLEDQYVALTRRLVGEVAGARPAERLAAVARALNEAGYMAEWDEGPRPGAGHLTERNCAIRAVAERYPEVCAAEHRFLETVLGAPVQRRAHIVGGCNACEYSIAFEPGSGAVLGAAPAPDDEEPA